MSFPWAILHLHKYYLGCQGPSHVKVPIPCTTTQRPHRFRACTPVKRTPTSTVHVHHSICMHSNASLIGFPSHPNVFLVYPNKWKYLASAASFAQQLLRKIHQLSHWTYPLSHLIIVGWKLSPYSPTMGLFIIPNNSAGRTPISEPIFNNSPSNYITHIFDS